MKYLLIALIFLGLSQNAYAHPGHSHDFMSALAHPFVGWDHLLSMLLVGMMVVRYPLKKGAFLPVTFVGCFSVAALIGTNDFLVIPMNLVDQFILISIIGFALMNAIQKTLPFGIAILVTGLFGFCHGYAHGQELAANQLLIITGIIISTALIHLLGFIAAQFICKSQPWMIRVFALLSGFTGLSALIMSY